MAFPYWNARPSARPSNRSKARHKNRLASKLEYLEGRELLSGVPAMHAAGGGAGLTGVSDYNLPGNFQFAAPSYSVNENGAFATFKVTRTFGSTGAVSVDYATGGGTAVAGVNYVATAGTLSSTTRWLPPTRPCNSRLPCRPAARRSARKALPP